MAELPKYYVAENYQRFREYLRQNNIAASDRYCILTDRIERLKGLYIEHPSQLVICFDPKAPFSFWVQLQMIMPRFERNSEWSGR